jgi:hypothetical protein
MITWVKKIRPVTGMHTITVHSSVWGRGASGQKSFNTRVFTTPNQSPIIKFLVRPLLDRGKSGLSKFGGGKSNPTMSIINNFPAGKMTHIRRCINLSDVEKGLNMQIGSTLPS